MTVLSEHFVNWFKGKSKENITLRPAEWSEHTYNGQSLNSAKYSPHLKGEGSSVYNRIAGYRLNSFSSVCGSHSQPHEKKKKIQRILACSLQRVTQSAYEIRK